MEQRNKRPIDIYRDYFRARFAAKVGVSPKRISMGYVDSDSVCGVLVKDLHKYDDYTMAKVVVSYLHDDGSKINEHYDAKLNNQTLVVEEVDKRYAEKFVSSHKFAVKSSGDREVDKARNYLYEQALLNIKKKVMKKVIGNQGERKMDKYEALRKELFNDNDATPEVQQEITPEMLFK